MVHLTAELINRLQELGVSTLHGPHELPDDCIFEAPCSLKWMNIAYRLRMGAFSYAVNGYYFGVEIGRYTSIGEAVQIGRGSHPVRWATTSPVFYQDYRSVVDHEFPAANGFRPTAPYQPPLTTRVGNDVYIGHGAFISAGVTIGDGAVVGAMAVVTKDVPPYAIVAGNPATVRSYRFSEPLIERLQRLAWWRFAFWDLQDAPISEPTLFADFVERRIKEGIVEYAPALIKLADLTVEPAVTLPAQPVTNPTRILYLIQCHASVAATKLLFRAIHASEHLYVLHIDSKAPANLTHLAHGLSQALPNVVVLDSEFISWGGYSQIRILIRAIDRFLTDAHDWTHLVVLSEQHLPLMDQPSIAAALEPGTSWLDATAFTHMPEAAQDDIRHRFDMAHRELAGVAPFADGKAVLPEGFYDRLHHASNWFVLSRSACHRLHEQFGNQTLVSVFETALQPDETLVPTLLAMQSDDGHSPIRARNASFVGYPHLSGTDDLTFSEQNFFEATAQGYLFIRKRPRILPRRVRAAVEAMCERSLEELDDLLAEATPPAFTPLMLQGSLENDLAHELTAHFDLKRPDVTVKSEDPGFENVPRLFLRFSKGEWQDRIAVYLMSEDMKSFKVSLIWLDSGRQSLKPHQIGRYLTVTSKARIRDLAYSRDVIDTDDADRGFLQINDIKEVVNVTSCVENFLARGDRFFEELVSTKFLFNVE